MRGRTGALALLLVVLLAVPAAVLGLRHAFQYDTDDLDPARESVIRVDVDTKRHAPRDIDVQALWGACAGPLTAEQLDGVAAPVAGHFLEFVVRPALGKDQRSRVAGCLNDLTVERLRTTGVTITDRPAAG